MANEKNPIVRKKDLKLYDELVKDYINIVQTSSKEELKRYIDSKIIYASKEDVNNLLNKI